MSLKIDVLNPNAESEKGKLFDSNSKTTFNNMVYLRSQEYVNQLKMEISCIQPKDLIDKFISVSDIEEYLEYAKNKSHDMILEFLNTKHIYIETGEKVIKDDYFIRFFFNYNYSIGTFRKKLRQKLFPNNQLEDFINRIDEDQSIKTK